MTTIKDIAKLSGYSIGTVSRVINHHPDVSESARKKIEEVIREQNFEPNSNARILKQQSSSAITIIVKGHENVFFEKILESVQTILRNSGEEAVVCFLDEEANEVQAAIQLVSSKKPKGFIFLGGNLEYFKDDFENVNVPSVILTNTAEELKFQNLSSFTTDDIQAGSYGIAYLLEKGHQNIGVIGGSASKDGSQVGYRRLKGIQMELENRDLPFDQSKQYEPSRFSMQGGYEAMKKLLLKNKDVTAVFALSDTVAFGAMRAIVDMGKRVPEDISILGYDGIDMARYTIPRLTTIHQDTDALARKGVENLLYRLNYPNSNVHEVVAFDLYDGESVIAYKARK